MGLLIIGLGIAIACGLGVLIGVLSRLGKGKNLVLATAVLMAGFGVSTLTVGTVAAAVGQPPEVSYPLWIVGGLMSLSGVIALVVTPGRFLSLELRRMQALD